MNIKIDAYDDEGTSLDYELLGNLEKWKGELSEKLNLLPFVDLSKLKDQNDILSFFINIYNLLNVHAIIEHGKRNKGQF
jgi:hypothetical protein